MLRLLLAWTAGFWLAASSPTARAAAAPWTIDDVINAERVTDFQVSPDGTQVVWVKSSPNPDKDESLSQIHWTDLATGEELQLTRGKISASRPRWSPDGRRIAFLSSRPDPDQDSKASDSSDSEGKAQIWILRLGGGEPHPITRGSRDVRQFEWRHTNALIFTAQEDISRLESARKEAKDKSAVTEDETNAPPVRLFEIVLDQKQPRRLSDNRDRISSFAVSPDGSRILALHDRSLRFTYDQRIRPALWLHTIDSGVRTQFLSDTPPMVTGMTWDRDSRFAYLAIARSSHPQYVISVVQEPHLLDTVTGQLTAIPLAWDRGLSETAPTAASGSTGLAPTADGFIALAADGVRNRLIRMVRETSGWRLVPIAGEHAAHVSEFSLPQKGDAIVYLHSRAHRLPQLYTAKLGARDLEAPRVLTRLNSALTEKPIGDVEIVRWRGANQVEIEGLLHKPPGFRPDRKYPLVLMIHGGPFWADKDFWDHSWAYAPSLFTQRDALILQPNYQGSSSYGLAFAESIANGKYYDLPVEDILKGIDHLVAQGSVDTNKLGTLGWSNGAILTMALVTRDPRFKAAAAGAGGVEWTADTGACVFGLSFNDYYFGATPWADPERYRKLSPYWRMDQVVTPVLIFQGSDDDIVPPHHAWMQFRLLQEHRKAPVRFLQLPGEAHSLRRLSSQRRKLEEELAWFDRYLFDKPTLPLKAPADPSPLARVLQLAEAARSGVRYGSLVHGKLIPETVRFEGLQVGRFEVTRAQFSEFAPGQPAETGRENYPVAGVSFETAQAYCAWLSQLTGESWRLPNASEAETLFSAAEPSSSENTLDYWAGYAPNPEDTQRLLSETQKLGGPGALLREVGSFAGLSKNESSPVFDLGGNVAEWTTAADGKGTLKGGSADAAADPKRAKPSSSTACQGFRVIRSDKAR